MAQAYHISTRNLLFGKVSSIEYGAVLANITIDLQVGGQLSAILPMRTIRDLGIEAGSEVYAIINEFDIGIGVDSPSDKHSERTNAISGTIGNIQLGVAHSTVQLYVNGKILEAIIPADTVCRLGLEEKMQACFLLQSFDVGVLMGDSMQYEYFAYMAITPLSAYGLGHSALILRKRSSISDTMQLYSFLASVSFGSLISGDSDEKGAVRMLDASDNDFRYSGGFTDKKVDWDYFIGNYSVFLNETAEANGNDGVASNSDRDSYKHLLGVQISEHQYSELEKVARACVEDGRNNVYGIDLVYNVMVNNCGDFVLKVLKKSADIELICDDSYDSVRFEYIGRGVRNLANSLPKPNRVRSVNGFNDIASIPNAIFDTFQEFKGSVYGGGFKEVL